LYPRPPQSLHDLLMARTFQPEGVAFTRQVDSIILSTVYHKRLERNCVTWVRR
jgi:hypothetical protein